MAVEIDIAVNHEPFPIGADRLREAAEIILSEHGVTQGALSIAVVDDPTIHEMNARDLAHDYPTDVLSYLFVHEDELLEGEIVVSADTAMHRSSEFEMAPADELLLYVIHGTLHLVGYDDSDDDSQQEMHEAEREFLTRLGVLAED
ncbi:MAG: rRNA maturation RNase YbeY [bacterium]|nr:rRNA maturation RNase YbeY [bacterium]